MVWEGEILSACGIRRWRRTCLREHTITDQQGVSFTLKEGKSYDTSVIKDGQLCVFSTYWVWVDAALFDEGEYIKGFGEL